MQSENNRRSFIELTDDELLNEALQGSLKKWKYYLHPTQSELVNSDFKGAMKLSGGAGTGKTVVALHRLKYLSKNRRFDAPILFTTFTKELTANLKSLADELEVSKNTYVIDNIDALAFRLAKERKLLGPGDKVFGFHQGIPSPKDLWGKVLETHLSKFDEGFLRHEYEQVILNQNIKKKREYFRAIRKGRGKPIGRRMRADIWKLIEEFEQLKKEGTYYYKEDLYNMLSHYLEENKEDKEVFSHVIVDELQDFSNVELRFIRHLTSEGKNDLFLVGDPFQNIYDKYITFSNIGINIRGRRSRRLRINYRTTEEIKNQAIEVLKGEDFEDFDGDKESRDGYLSLFHGVEPIYQTFSSQNEQLKVVSEEINKLVGEGYNHSDIMIAARDWNTVKGFRNYLHQNDILYVTRNLLDSDNEGIRLSTFHGMKGLEFKHVFLVGVNKRSLPFLPPDFDFLEEEEKKAIIKREKALFYVCCSRAVERLMISGVGEGSNLLK